MTQTSEVHAHQASPSRNQLLSNEVRVLLARRRLPALALAPVLGKSQQAVSDRMRGARAWGLDDLDALARFFDVDANTLLPGLGMQAPAAQESATTPYRAAAGHAPQTAGGEATLPLRAVLLASDAERVPLWVLAA